METTHTHIHTKQHSFWKLLGALLLCEGTGILSGIISGSSMNTWYYSLNKPSWNPPSEIFGFVWGILYFLMAIALWIVWKKDVVHAEKRKALFWFFLQLFFNFCWSFFFFGRQSLVLALSDIFILDILVLITIVRFDAISRKAAWLMVPYMLWICFATVLNYTIWSMN
ncbi:MAG TPA: TspO/MBR family protein [Cytophagaceae bacterium]|jgi:tryptophan-rich sensory protein|nr:TspO/MBR family protein [Cytophagaceae bacterium]